jgi:hypothetical protein
MDKDQEFSAVQSLKVSSDMVKRLYSGRYKTDYTDLEIQQKLEAAGFQVGRPSDLKYASILPVLTTTMVQNRDKVKAFNNLIDTKLGAAISTVQSSTVDKVAGIIATFNQEVTALAASM